MLFPNTFSADIRKHGKRFIPVNIQELPDVGGVYILFHNRNFVYVGKSENNQGVRKRLTNHYDGSSNEKLRNWLEALDGDVKFTYISCRTDEVDDLERSLICYLQPIANKIMYRDYRPKPTKWRKTHG